MNEVITDLRGEILKEHSKAQCNKIIAWVADDQKRFDELFHLFLSNERLVAQRAAWPVSYCVLAHPFFIQKRFGELVAYLQKPGIHDAIKRNTVRLLQGIDIPKKYHGRIMDCCFRYVASPTETVAVKAFSLSVLGNLAKQYPDIVPEIKLLIEEQLPSQTAAFKSRVTHLLKNFSAL